MNLSDNHFYIHATADIRKCVDEDEATPVNNRTEIRFDAI